MMMRIDQSRQNHVSAGIEDSGTLRCRYGAAGNAFDNAAFIDDDTAFRPVGKNA
jgi:hypothetical protein